ncbi:hypothetical protein [Streptomyces sp. AC627_RSS907]|uniref:hypothetical protein n=1 Tax=Streptomyces sp. AC627_RSS907 TaxID=2823684 RepID=UPI001C2401C1|nr:hypothetical protein [Streptomyces sp. AC627_RSS907]
MSALVIGAVAVVGFARGRWTGPPWLILVGAVLGWPVGFLTVRATGESGLLTYAFPVACGMLLTTLISPLYHRRTGIGATESEKVRR